MCCLFYPIGVIDFSIFYILLLHALPWYHIIFGNSLAYTYILNLLINTIRCLVKYTFNYGVRTVGETI